MICHMYTFTIFQNLSLPCTPADIDQFIESHLRDNFDIQNVLSKVGWKSSKQILENPQICFIKMTVWNVVSQNVSSDTAAVM